MGDQPLTHVAYLYKTLLCLQRAAWLAEQLLMGSGAYVSRHVAPARHVGGYAVGYHGFPRYTGDLNIFVAIGRENAAALLSAFSDFGFGSLGLRVEDFIEPDTIVEIGREPIKIQILAGIDGVTFERCREDRVIKEVDGLELPFIGLESLLESKAATQRAKDRIDFEELKRIREEKRRNSGTDG